MLVIKPTNIYVSPLLNNRDNGVIIKNRIIKNRMILYIMTVTIIYSCYSSKVSTRISKRTSCFIQEIDTASLEFYYWYKVKTNDDKIIEIISPKKNVTFCKKEIVKNKKYILDLTVTTAVKVSENVNLPVSTNLLQVGKKLINKFRLYETNDLKGIYICK